MFSTGKEREESMSITNQAEWFKMFQVKETIQVNDAFENLNRELRIVNKDAEILTLKKEIKRLAFIVNHLQKKLDKGNGW